MSQLEPMVQSLQHMTSVNALPGFFQQIQQQFGYLYTGIVMWRAQRSPVVVSAQAHTQFHRLVNSERLHQFCQNRCTPAQSSTTEFSDVNDDNTALLVIPLKGMGTDSGALLIGLTAEQAALAQQIAWYWTIIAHYVVETLYRIGYGADAEPPILLTSREKACLSWAAKGKTSWEISQILSISERTVNFHLGNCISKTDSNNRQQAITRCLAAGYINL